MKDICFICNSHVKEVTTYSRKCINCNYYFSNLEPGVGQDVSGREELRRKNFKKLLQEVQKLKSDPYILEIGSGDGFFLDECLKLGIRVVGSEASKFSIKKLKKKFSKEIDIIELNLPESIERKIKKKFDFIIFNDVFEHLVEINNVLVEIKKGLKKGGFIIVNLPSSDGIIFKVSKFLTILGFDKFYNRLWQKDMSSPHLSYFNKKNLNKLFKTHSFENVKSGFLDSLCLNNYERIRNLYSNSFVTFLASVTCCIFYLFHRVLPKDIIYIFFKKINRSK